MALITVNMVKEVAEYYSTANLDDIADIMLESFDFESLPPTSIEGDRVEKKVNVSNPYFLKLREKYGRRSKRVSLARLFEYGYNIDILRSHKFSDTSKVKKEDPVPSLLTRAYKALLDARKYHECNEITDVINRLGKVRTAYDNDEI